MAQRVTEIRHQELELEPLPEAQVVYAPETQTLSIRNGLRVKDSEEIDKGVTAFYDVVALSLTGKSSILMKTSQPSKAGGVAE